MSLTEIADGVTNQGSFNSDNLIAGEYPRISRIVTVTGGAPLPQGAVLGRIDSDGRYQSSDASLSDGSEVPDAILAEALDASVADIQAHVFITGEFNALALTIGAGHTLNSVTQAFRQRSIFLRNNQA